MESAYNFTEYRYRLLKESQEIFSAGFKCPGFVKIRTPSGEEYNKVEEKFLEDIRQDVLRTKTHIKDIILKCISTSYDVYRDETKRLSREIFELRNWLWEAQQRNKELSREIIKKEKEAERKERIILEKSEKIRKVSQEVESTRIELKKARVSTKNYGKRNRVNREKSITEIQVDQLPIEKIDTSLYQVTPIEILVYDIPARWKDEDIIKVFRSLGMVRRMSIKKQFKYKSVKLCICLKLDQVDAEWRSRHSINIQMNDKMYWFRWFPEYMKLSDIRERFKYTAYKEVKADLKNLTDEEILEFYKGHGDWFYGKIIFIKGKKFIYVYFANENKLEQAVTESLGQGIQEAWIFPQKKKNFDYFISSGSGMSSHVKGRDENEMVVNNIDKEEISDKVKYSEDDMRRIVEKAIDDQVKEKELIREELLKFKYTDDDVRKIVVKETDDLIKEQELIKEKLARFKYTEEDLEKRVAKAVKSRDSRLKYMEEEAEEKVKKAVDHLIRKREWTQDFVDYGKYKYTEKDVDDMMALYKYTEKDLESIVAQKLEEQINEQREKDKEIISKFKYTDEDVNELVAKAIEDQIKEKNLFKENVMKTAREIASMMGLKLDDIDFSVSSVNKDRQTEVLFQEIQKANAKRMTKDDFSKLDDKLREPVDANCHVTNEGMEGTYKGLNQKEIAGEVPVSAEEIEIYNK
ncbi:hypothetical protein RhiirA5_471372, partial [Rhizophagus irregularis]